MDRLSRIPVNEKERQAFSGGSGVSFHNSGVINGTVRIIQNIASGGNTGSPLILIIIALVTVIAIVGIVAMVVGRGDGVRTPASIASVQATDTPIAISPPTSTSPPPPAAIQVLTPTSTPTPMLTPTSTPTPMLTPRSTPTPTPKATATLNAQTAFYDGEYYYDLGEYQKAVIYYSEALLLDPEYVWSYGNRGNAYYNLG
jgi:hypothetical protein